MAAASNNGCSEQNIPLRCYNDEICAAAVEEIVTLGQPSLTVPDELDFEAFMGALSCMYIFVYE